MPINPSTLATLTILVKRIREIKIVQAIAKNSGLYGNRIPAPVATALPPLNLVKIEKVWPATAPTPISSGLTVAATPNIYGRLAAIIPFETSITKTIVPAFGPRTR